MAVIFLKKRHTTDAKEFDRYRKSDSSLILTDAKCVDDFSLELTMGDLYDDDLSEERAIMYAIEEDYLTIQPKSSVVVELSQYIRVPNNMYGIVMPKGYILLEQGILMASTKIEPAYNGKLRILLFNTTRSKRKIRKDVVIASAVFFGTDKTLEEDHLTGREPVISKKKGALRRTKDFIAEDARYFLMLLSMILTSSLAAAILVYFLTKTK